MKKSLFYLGLISVIICTVLISSNIVEAKKQTPVKDVSVQEEAAGTYEKLISSFSVKSFDRTSGKQVEEKKYPEGYGGSYIDDKGNFVVFLKGDLNEQKRMLRIPEKVILKKADFSYNELLAVMDKLNKYKAENKDYISSIFNEFGLFDSRNRVVVKLDKLDEKHIAMFKEKVSDSAAIVFEKGNGPIKVQFSKGAGSNLRIDGSTASLGYRARRNGVDGFVTAGHFASYVGAIVKDESFNNVHFGKCYVTQQSGNVDAAFCAVTHPTYDVSNTLEITGAYLSPTISEPGVGTVINKIGMTTGHTSGKILSTNITATFTNGNTIYNMTTADYNCDFGDSGCPVYSYVESANIRYTLGIHTGLGNGISYYTKANEINRALGTSRY